MSVVSEERKRIILENLEAEGKVKVADLAKKFSVSTETIRRYLEDLDKNQKLKKVYGGAVKNAPPSLIEPSMVERKILNIEKKKRIAYKAATFIQNGDVILVDEGSTTLQLVPYLMHIKELTIITNSFPFANQLISATNNKMFTGEIVFIGGTISPQHFRTAGPMSQQILTHLSFDRAFISVDALLPDFGISSYNLEKAKLSEMMINQAEKTYVLADHSKIGLKGTYKITELNKIDYILSNQPLSKAWEGHLLENDVKWIHC